MIQLFDFNLGDNEDERVNVEIIKQNTIEREDIMNDGYVGQLELLIFFVNGLNG